MVHVDPVERVRSASRRFAEPVESMAQTVARRATELVVEALDVNALLDRTDMNRLLDQIDVNRVLDRIDVDSMIERVDLQALLNQVDVNELADRIDVAALLDKTELSALVARSSTTIFSEGVDLARSQAVGLDHFLARGVDRLLRRGTARPAAPLGPPLLVISPGTAMTAGHPPGDEHEQGLWGHYAGVVSRFAGYVVDLAVSTGIFMLALAAASFAASLVTGHAINWSRGNIGVAIALAVWQFLYYAYSWAAAGKTFGMALLGVRVVRRDGAEVDVPHAIIRTLAFPLSFLLCGLGFAGIALGRERRALHDVIADTAVVYTWQARAQRLGFLARPAALHVPALPDGHAGVSAARPPAAVTIPAHAPDGVTADATVPTQPGSPERNAATPGR